MYTGGEIIIPAEVMRYAGESPFLVSGYKSEDGEMQRKVISCPGVLFVENTLDDTGNEPEIPTPTAFEDIVEKLGAPYIGENGNWYVWDADTRSFTDTGLPSRGAQGVQGETGKGLTIGAHFDTLAELEAAAPTAAPGTAASVGTTIPFTIYIYDGTHAKWVEHGTFRGVGIKSVSQTVASGVSSGVNEISIELDDGTNYLFAVYNGERGPAGSIAVSETAPGVSDDYTIWVNPNGTADGTGGAYVLNVLIGGAWTGIPTLKGESGENAVLRVSGDYLQWKLSGAGDSAWKNLFDFSTIQTVKGDKGDTGAAGHTPVRGTDYWTSDDIATIKSYVNDAILGGEW